MAINLQNGFTELRDHVGHDIVCAAYSDSTADAGGDVANVALECETCGSVLLDFTNPTWEAP